VVELRQLKSPEVHAPPEPEEDSGGGDVELVEEGVGFELPDDGGGWATDKVELLLELFGPAN